MHRSKLQAALPTQPASGTESNGHWLLEFLVFLLVGRDLLEESKVDSKLEKLSSLKVDSPQRRRTVARVKQGAKGPGICSSCYASLQDCSSSLSSSSLNSEEAQCASSET